MHIAPDNILVSCTIALLLSGWSFLFCYFFLIKAPVGFYIFFSSIVAVDLFLAPLYGIGILLIAASTVAALFHTAIHSLLEKKFGNSELGCFSFFWFHYSIWQLPYLVISGSAFVTQNRTVDAYLKPFESSGFLHLILFVGPSLGLIPLYMFKTYRPRPGMDTHFPDVGNN